MTLVAKIYQKGAHLKNPNEKFPRSAKTGQKTEVANMRFC